MSESPYGGAKPSFAQSRCHSSGKPAVRSRGEGLPFLWCARTRFAAARRLRTSNDLRSSHPDDTATLAITAHPLYVQRLALPQNDGRFAAALRKQGCARRARSERRPRSGRSRVAAQHRQLSWRRGSSRGVNAHPCVWHLRGLSPYTNAPAKRVRIPPISPDRSGWSQRSLHGWFELTVLETLELTQPLVELSRT